MTSTAKCVGVCQIDYCQKGEIMAEAQPACIRRFGYDALTLDSNAVREAETVGAQISWQEDEVAGTTGETLNKSRDDLSKLKLADPMGENRAYEQIKPLKILRREIGDDEIVYAWLEAPFQESAMLRNINYFLKD